MAKVVITGDFYSSEDCPFYRYGPRPEIGPGIVEVRCTLGANTNLNSECIGQMCEVISGARKFTCPYVCVISGVSNY